MAIVGSLACTGAIREPRQNDNWTLPPAQYGDVYFQGLRAPQEPDGGQVGNPAEETLEPLPKVQPTESRRGKAKRRKAESTESQTDAGAPEGQEREIFLD